MKGGAPIDVLGGSWHSFRVYECCVQAFAAEEQRQHKAAQAKRRKR